MTGPASPAGPALRRVRVVLGPVTGAAYLVPAVLAVLGLVAVLAALGAPAATPGSPIHDVRATATTLFLLLGPGWAVAGFVDRPSLGLHFVLAVAVSVALGILGAQVMVVLGAWHPVGLLVGVAALSVPLLVRHAVRAP